MDISKTIEQCFSSLVYIWALGWIQWLPVCNAAVRLMWWVWSMWRCGLQGLRLIRARRGDRGIVRTPGLKHNEEAVQNSQEICWAGHWGEYWVLEQDPRGRWLLSHSPSSAFSFWNSQIPLAFWWRLSPESPSILTLRGCNMSYLKPDNSDMMLETFQVLTSISVSFTVYIWVLLTYLSLAFHKLKYTSLSQTKVH